MSGRGNPQSLTSALSSNGSLYSSSQEKANVLLDAYSSVSPYNIPAVNEYDVLINCQIASPSLSPLNDDFSENELDFGLTKLKSRAMGKDLIRNEMLRNLSDKNKLSVLHLFNLMFRSSYVPTH